MTPGKGYKTISIGAAKTLETSNRGGAFGHRGVVGIWGCKCSGCVCEKASEKREPLKPRKSVH